MFNFLAKLLDVLPDFCQECFNALRVPALDDIQ